MAVLLDTGALVAYYDRKDPWHQQMLALFSQEVGALIVPSPVIPEVDHLLGRELGQRAQASFYLGLGEGDFFVVDLPREGYARVAELNRDYTDLRLGFVDAAVMAIAELMGLGRVATTDRRDFGAVRLKLPLTLLP